jgi:Lrp/AsnC family transcriptional regulator, cysteine-sensing transcriptional activator
MAVDGTDLKILRELQKDATLPVTAIAERVGLTATPCWRRIQKLEAEGYIRRRVALLDPKKLNVGVTVFIAVRTNQHNERWLKQFHDVVASMPEVVDFFRMSGAIDYLIRAVLPDIEAYDALYKRLIARVDMQDVSSMFAMEQIKSTTELPLSYARPAE